MAKIAYKECNFRRSTLNLIETCNGIIREYQRDGLKLTLRQLYYQLVSRDVIPNQIKEYNRLGSTVNDARLAGLIDWSSIEDRTRNLESIGHWDDPADIIGSCAASFRIDKWATQPIRTEVWIEKEALAGVFERVCSKLDVPYLSCRGYTEFGESSWELDALNPRVLAALVRENIASVRDETKWAVAVEEESGHRATLSVMSDNWSAIEDFTTDQYAQDVEDEKQSQITKAGEED